MKIAITFFKKHPWILFVAAFLIVLALIWTLSAPPARAALGGFSEVSTLDLYYTPGNLVEARVHLVVGVALMHQAQSGEESERLFEIAQILSGRKAKLYVELENDKIKSFQISVL